MKNPFGWMKNKKVWAKIGTTALDITSAVIPMASPAKAVVEMIKEVRKAEELKVPGPEKKEIVMTRLDRFVAMSGEMGDLLRSGIDAYVALWNFWTKLKAAYTKIKA